MKRVFTALMLAGLLLTSCKSQTTDRTTVTTLSICAVTEKAEQDGYYLTVQLEDWTVEEYSLSSDLLTLQTNESIYKQTTTGDDFAGISLVITIPDTEPTMDIGSVLKGGHTDYCAITAITTADNQTIT